MTFLAVAIVAMIVAGIVVFIVWRMRAHLAARAEAEVRMAAAMQELQILAARLQAVKAAQAARGESDSTPTP
jgi:hypothetical protein